MPNTRQDDINPNVWIGLTFPLGRNEGVGFFNQSKTFFQQIDRASTPHTGRNHLTIYEKPGHNPRLTPN